MPEVIRQPAVDKRESSVVLWHGSCCFSARGAGARHYNAAPHAEMAPTSHHNTVLGQHCVRRLELRWPSTAVSFPAAAQPPPSVARAKERKPDVNDGAIDIQSDHATLGVDGNATLKGNVNVRQGDRQIHADEIQYNSKSNGFRTDSGLEYEDPVVKITGDGGNYSPVRRSQLPLGNLRSSATSRTRIRRRAPADTSGCASI